jgi:alginate O-acetyltransferase complex protein AlgJ
MPRQHPNVLVGRDEFLFLTGDTNDVIAQVEGRYRLEPGFIDDTIRVHAERAYLCAAHGMWYRHVIAPNKETVMATHLPDTVVPRRNGPTPMDSYIAGGGTPFFQPALLQRNDGPPTYYAQDSHWSTYGASLTLAAVLQEVGVAAVASTAALAALTRSPRLRKGDLGSKIALQGETVLDVANPHKGAALTYANGVRNDGTARLFRNAAAASKCRLLILHDSFGTFMSDLASLIFRDVLFLHTPHFDPHFICSGNFDGVIFVQAERFFVRKPLNQKDYRSLLSKNELAQKGCDTFDQLLAHVDRAFAVTGTALATEPARPTAMPADSKA